jgi:hypothetical protein
MRAAFLSFLTPVDNPILHDSLQELCNWSYGESEKVTESGIERPVHLESTKAPVCGLGPHGGKRRSGD